MEEARLPAHLEATALIRQVQGAGGFATVIQKGDADAGTFLLVLVENGRKPRLFERMPQADGVRKWQCTLEAAEFTEEINAYLSRRANQDADLWVLELDIAHGERFIL
ncbi:MAG: DUF1491 family protein [Novosphingobium sp.]